MPALHVIMCTANQCTLCCWCWCCCCVPQEACDLSLTFQQLPGLLLQLLDLLVRQPSTYLARLMMQGDGSAAMEFAQVWVCLLYSIIVSPPAAISLIASSDYMTAGLVVHVRKPAKGCTSRCISGSLASLLCIAAQTDAVWSLW